MLNFRHTSDPSAAEGFRESSRRRATGIVAALALEALLILLLFSLGRSEPGGQVSPVTTIAAFDASSPEQAAQPEPEPEQAEAETPPIAEETPTAQPEPPERPAPDDAPRPPALIPISPSEMAAADIAPPPARPSPAPPPAQGPAQGPMMGPAAPSSGSDTPRVGTAPNGEPLYAARWYREPYDNELAGYLSTASGPGWALIVCRTVEGYRVEDCVPLEESPRGSNIARAVLAAAWQFQVRPPRIGGRSQVGAWVRIRIDYGIRRQ